SPGGRCHAATAWQLVATAAALPGRAGPPARGGLPPVGRGPGADAARERRLAGHLGPDLAGLGAAPAGRGRGAAGPRAAGAALGAGGAASGAGVAGRRRPRGGAGGAGRPVPRGATSRVSRPPETLSPRLGAAPCAVLARAALAAARRG